MRRGARHLVRGQRWCRLSGILRAWQGPGHPPEEGAGKGVPGESSAAPMVCGPSAARNSRGLAIQGGDDSRSLSQPTPAAIQRLAMP